MVMIMIQRMSRAYRVTDDGGEFDDVDHDHDLDARNEADDRVAYYQLADYPVRLVKAT